MSFSRVFFTIVSLFVVPVFAQIPAITGWVYNKKTLETIPGAIIVDSASFAFVESNAQGFYQFGTKQGDKTIIVAAPGYKSGNRCTSLSKQEFLPASSGVW
jgi:hypothetical protein